MYLSISRLNLTILKNHGGWDEVKLQSVLLQQICNNILDTTTPNNNNNVNDKVIWTLNKLLQQWRICEWY
jgi:hypothetical protein